MGECWAVRRQLELDMRRRSSTGPGRWAWCGSPGRRVAGSHAGRPRTPSRRPGVPARPAATRGEQVADLRPRSQKTHAPTSHAHSIQITCSLHSRSSTPKMLYNHPISPSYVRRRVKEPTPPLCIVMTYFTFCSQKIHEDIYKASRQ